MTNLKIDFSKSNGKIKYMNCVNNGPVSSVRAFSNFQDYKNARIPYARNHDASFYSGFGGEFSVDVHRIFRDFDADVNDPKSYSFASTDDYVKTTYEAGTKVFYRLGAAIEHYEKRGTFPPKNFQKWAEICEHIVLHYTQGWANGFYYDMEYWEIWNEADCKNRDGSNPCWQGTDDEFADFFLVAFRHLKSKFPNLKIGGPAFAWQYGCPDLIDKVFTKLNSEGLKLDFYSFHTYNNYIESLVCDMRRAKGIVDKYGQSQAELILNEWNYVKGWAGEDWAYTLRTEKGLKGASFITGVMCAGQREPVDMLMYYDARPCAMNGMFATDTFEKLKGYYPIAYFSNLLDLGTYVPSECDDELIYSCMAKNGNAGAGLFTYYCDDDSSPKKTLELELCSLPKNANVCIYILDSTRDMEKIMELTVSDFVKISLPVSVFDTYYIEYKA